MGWAPHPNCAEGRSEVAQRGSHESQGLEEGSSMGLGGLPGGEDLGGRCMEGRGGIAGQEVQAGRGLGTPGRGIGWEPREHAL